VTDLHQSRGLGSVGGIIFDFRHDEIPDGWEPIHGLGSRLGTGGIWPYSRGPRIIFPWSEKRRKRSAKAISRLGDREILREVVKFGPHGCVAPGDTLTIASVKSRWVGDEYDPEVDAQIFRVRYLVTHPDGKQDHIRNYSIYVHRDSHWAVRIRSNRTEGGLSLAVVRSRLNLLLGPDDVDVDGNPTEHCEISAAACLDVINLCAAPDWETHRGKPGSPLETRREQSLIEAGFFLAKAEAAYWMGPYAERGLANETARQNASAARSQVADPIRDAARDYIAANPRTSQSACASRIASLHGLNQRSVERVISAMFEWRELAGGRREKRAKSEFLPGRPDP